MTHVYQPLAGGGAYFTSGLINGSMAVGGTWSAYSTLTLPAYTLGGTVTSNGQSFSGTIANLGTVTTVDINGGTIDGVALGGASAVSLGTPSSGTLTNCSGLPVSTGIAGLGTGVATFLATPSSANLASAVTGETGSGALVFATSPSFTTPTINTAASVGGTWTAAATWTLPAFTLGGTVTSNGQSFSGTIANLGTVTTADINGGTIDGVALGGSAAVSLGTPSSGTLTNCGGLPVSTGISGLGTGVATFLATPSSANLASAVTGETGSGALVFGTSPSLTTPTINTAASVGGSWTAAATWTLPAFTLGGTVTSNGQSFSGTIANLGTVTTADINGGTIDGAAIGGSSSSTGIFTSLAAGTTAKESGTTVHFRMAYGEYVLFESIGSNANFSMRRANGTAGSLTALVDGDLIGAYAWRGHDGSAVTLAKARIDGYANGNWSGSATGADIAFLVTDPAGTTIAEKLRLTGDGRLYGKSLHNNSGSDTGTTNQYILSKTYTPTFTNTTNITSSTANAESTCVRVGNIAIVGVLGTIRPAAAGGCALGVSLPIASSFTNAAQLQGCGSYAGLTDILIYSDATNDRATLYFVAPADPGSEVTFSCTFIYTIL